MLASAFAPEKAKFPYILTPKIDGIRFVMVDGVALSKTFKPIRNRFIQSMLSKYLPDGIDGELTSGDTFQSTTSAVMSVEGEPEFKAWVFDYVNPELEYIKPFVDRIAEIDLPANLPFPCEVLCGAIANDMAEVEAYKRLYDGYEGVMLRDPAGTYKFGRATVRENILLKVKDFEDAEGVIIGFEEKMHNDNPATLDAFGKTKRSTARENLVPAGTLGKLILRDAETGQEVRVGSGFDDKLRDEIWSDRPGYLDRLVKYKFFPFGVKDKPRHAVFIGFRDAEDM